MKFGGRTKSNQKQKFNKRRFYCIKHVSETIWPTPSSDGAPWALQTSLFDRSSVSNSFGARSQNVHNFSESRKWKTCSREMLLVLESLLGIRWSFNTMFSYVVCLHGPHVVDPGLNLEMEAALWTLTIFHIFPRRALTLTLCCKYVHAVCKRCTNSRFKTATGINLLSCGR